MIATLHDDIGICFSVVEQRKYRKSVQGNLFEIYLKHLQDQWEELKPTFLPKRVDAFRHAKYGSSFLKMLTLTPELQHLLPYTVPEKLSATERVFMRRVELLNERIYELGTYEDQIKALFNEVTASEETEAFTQFHSKLQHYFTHVFNISFDAEVVTGFNPQTLPLYEMIVNQIKDTSYEQCN